LTTESTTESTTETSAFEDLLGHGAWMQRFAVSLVGAGDPEDLVQDAWVAALEAPPRGKAEAARPWLGRVVRNLAVDRFRSRRVRERAAPEVSAASEAEAPSGEQLLAQARIKRDLAELLEELDPAFRTTLLLRFHEDKSSAEIARELGVPAGTVRWRLHTGLAQLRQKLDQRHGGERARWVALLMPAANRRLVRDTATASVASAGLLATLWSALRGWHGAGIAALSTLVVGVGLLVVAPRVCEGDRQASDGQRGPAAGPTADRVIAAAPPGGGAHRRAGSDLRRRSCRWCLGRRHGRAERQRRRW
jgi:RNA polymerase sigma-70 factor (ECF subfamily)